MAGIPPAVIRGRLAAAVEHPQLVVDAGQLGLGRVHRVVERVVVVVMVAEHGLRQVLRGQQLIRGEAGRGGSGCRGRRLVALDVVVRQAGQVRAVQVAVPVAAGGWPMLVPGTS